MQTLISNVPHSKFRKSSFPNAVKQIRQIRINKRKKYSTVHSKQGIFMATFFIFALNRYLFVCFAERA